MVDIGDTVEKGQLLAEVYDPERQQEVELTAAEVERAKAAVEQSKAMVTTAEAEVKTAEANVDVRKTEISQTAAIRRFREKEYIRYMEIARHQAVDQRVADEKQDEYKGAKAAEDKAHASVKAAETELSRARAQSSRPRPIWNTHAPSNVSQRPDWARPRSWPSTRALFPLIRVW